MKGQAVFEFVVAAVLFFGIIFYVINFLSTSFYAHELQSHANNMESNSLEIAEFLVHIKLAKEWPVLSYDSIDDFNGTCNNDYVGVLEKFDLGENKLKIKINEGGRVLLDCLDDMTVPDTNRAEAERYALSEKNKIISVQVVVW